MLEEKKVALGRVEPSSTNRWKTTVLHNDGLPVELADFLEIDGGRWTVRQLAVEFDVPIGTMADALRRLEHVGLAERARRLHAVPMFNANAGREVQVSMPVDFWRACS